ncbi:MAG: hypothetical protein JOZ22_16685, partial [Acidobacteriia bacterium]|nr:hypothetical protein [Terriglobia bacterium]
MVRGLRGSWNVARFWRGFFSPVFGLRWIGLSAAVCAVAWLLWGTNRDLSPTPPIAGTGAEPNAHHSYVRGVCPNGAGYCIVATDRQYAADIRANFTGGAVDIVMQQCFGGGFKDDIQNASAAPRPGSLARFTFASSTSWGRCSWSVFLPMGAVNPVTATYVENFTRAWRKDAQLFSNDGLFPRYQLAAGDGIVTIPPTLIPKDLYAPPGHTIGATTYTEYPQYASPDPNPGGANDSRPFPPPPNGRRFVLLVAWDDVNQADIGVDIARMNDTSYQVIGAPVPVRRIVTLYGNTARNTNIGPFPDIAPQGNIGDGSYRVTRTFFVDGTNARANWISALKGDFFISDQTPNQLGVTYGPNDTLLIYNTGHGGNENVAAPAVVGVNALRFNVPLAAGGYEAVDADPSLASVVTDPDGTDLLQISTRRPVTDSSIQLAVNGAAFGSLASLAIS